VESVGDSKLLSMPMPDAGEKQLILSSKMCITMNEGKNLTPTFKIHSTTPFKMLSQNSICLKYVMFHICNSCLFLVLSKETAMLGGFPVHLVMPKREALSLVLFRWLSLHLTTLNSTLATKILGLHTRLFNSRRKCQSIFSALENVCNRTRGCNASRVSQDY